MGKTGPHDFLTRRHMANSRSPTAQSTEAGVTQGEDHGFFSSRQRVLLRRLASFSLLAMLLIFWAFSVYTMLVAGWWLLNGYSFLEEEQNPFIWNGPVDWILMILALSSIWPAQRWLRVQIAHFMEVNPEPPHKFISQLSQQIDGVQTVDEQMAGLVHLLARTLNMPFVSIETETDGESVVFGEQPNRSLITLPLQYNQIELGTLKLAPRLIGGTPVRVDEQLLQDLAYQISLTLYTMQLSADLQASRRRIVTAREEARRQLRRDLHDGLGPSLAAMTMQADTARELVYDDPQLTEQLLANLVDQTQTMVDDIRRLVHGLRPPALDDVGLLGALELLVGSFSVPDLLTTIRLPAKEPVLTAAMEVAIYRIVQEGLTNVRKHARADNAAVTLDIDDERLILSIVDDGVGMPDQPIHGVGLHSMRERAEELGGTLNIHPNSPTGSCIVARLPLDPGATNGPDSHPHL